MNETKMTKIIFRVPIEVKERMNENSMRRLERNKPNLSKYLRTLDEDYVKNSSSLKTSIVRLLFDEKELNKMKEEWNIKKLLFEEKTPLRA